jgi:hypothetical protein
LEAFLGTAKNRASTIAIVAAGTLWEKLEIISGKTGTARRRPHCLGALRHDHFPDGSGAIPPCAGAFFSTERPARVRFRAQTNRDALEIGPVCNSWTKVAAKDTVAGILGCEAKAGSEIVSGSVSREPGQTNCVNAARPVLRERHRMCR